MLTELVEMAPPHTCTQTAQRAGPASSMYLIELQQPSALGAQLVLSISTCTVGNSAI